MTENINKGHFPSIYVTKPYLPCIEEYMSMLPAIWESRILSNSGAYHQALEKALSEQLGVKQLALINNGTIALELAIHVLGLKGKIITTPYSFVATANSILLKGLGLIFVDIEDEGFNLDPDLLDDVMDSDVSAVMPVHVYGLPCKHVNIDAWAKSNDVKVIYDAAHAFGVKQDGESALNWGDASTLSFHATKVFHTFEGGAVACQDPFLKRKIDIAKNFGFDGDGDVVTLGTNGKMNEAQAAMGLVLLNHIDTIKEKRKQWHDSYIEQLKDIVGISLMKIPENLDYNYAYFPIIVGGDFPISRDELCEHFMQSQIFPRKYFYPLITDFSLYKSYNIISRHKVPNAKRIAESVLCLPLYPDLSEDDVGRVCDVIRKAMS